MADNILDRFDQNMTAATEIDSSKKLRIGFIGTGGNANSHIQAYLKQPDVEIVCGADLIAGKARKFLDNYKLLNAKDYTDYKQMIAENKLDAVSVCTYNSQHAPCAIYAMEHGLNVLLEKPFTVTLEEAVAVRKAEKESGKVLSIGFQPRFDANMKMIKKIVESGELGEIYYIQTGGGRRHGIPVGWSTTFIEGDKGVLGAIGDIGCYSLDMCLNAMGYPKPVTVSGRISGFFGRTPEAYSSATESDSKRYADLFAVDDFASAYIRLDNGVVLDFRIAWYMHLDTPGDTIIMGKKGSLRIPSTDCWNGSVGGAMKIYHDICGKPTETIVPLLKNPEGVSNVDMKIRSFLDAIKNGTPSPIPSSQIIINQAIIDGIVKSSEVGHEIEINIPGLD